MAPKIFLCIFFVAVLLASEATSGTMVEGSRKECFALKGRKCYDKDCDETCIARHSDYGHNGGDVVGHCVGDLCCCFY
ncbi:hypothetical protein HN51_024239 [Arachis hypogaea]|nr:uncharacterized protein DS421_7g206530 [Arachis hypogaea]